MCAWLLLDYLSLYLYLIKINTTRGAGSLRVVVLLDHHLPSLALGAGVGHSFAGPPEEVCELLPDPCLEVGLFAFCLGGDHPGEAQLFAELADCRMDLYISLPSIHLRTDYPYNMYDPLEIVNERYKIDG